MIDQHEYGESFTGMSCGAMVMRNGGGDQCGLPSEHPIHVGWLEVAIKLAIGYEPSMVSLAPGVGGLTHRTAQDRDELVERISAKLAESISLIEADARTLGIRTGIEWLQYVDKTLAIQMDHDIAVSEGLVEGKMFHPPHDLHISEAWPTLRGRE